SGYPRPQGLRRPISVRAAALGAARSKSLWLAGGAHVAVGQSEDRPATEADALRRSVHSKECWCTNEVFLWPSITYQPVQLAKALIGSRAWAKSEALGEA